MSSTTGDNISKPPTEDDGPPIKSANCHRKIGLPVLPTTKSVSSDAGDQDGNGTTIDIGKFQLHADGDFLFAVRLSGLLFALEIDPHLDG